MSDGGSLDAEDQAYKVWLLQGGNGRFLLQALSKTVNIKLGKKNEALLKEILRKNSPYGSVDVIMNEAVEMFHASEKKKRSKSHQSLLDGPEGLATGLYKICEGSCFNPEYKQKKTYTLTLDIA